LFEEKAIRSIVKKHGVTFSIFLLGGTLTINLDIRHITKTCERWDGRLKMKLRLKMRGKIA
jgi:hypothetical protein